MGLPSKESIPAFPRRPGGALRRRVTPVTGSLLLDLLVVAAAAVGLGYLLFRVLVQGKSSTAVTASAKAAASASSPRQTSPGGPVAVRRAPRPSWPADLRSVREDGRTCLLVLSGPDFEASSWAAKEKMVGALAGAQSRLWLLRLRAPEVRQSLFLRRSAKSQEACSPTRFQGRVAVEEPFGGLFAGGTIARRSTSSGRWWRASGQRSWILTAPAT